jgi:transposase-like protein
LCLARKSPREPHDWTRIGGNCLGENRLIDENDGLAKIERAPGWRRAWEHVVPFFAFASRVRKMIYTTNAVEALNRSLRKIIKTRGSFPNDDAALKLVYLAIKNAGLRWRRGVEWTAAMGQFAIQFGPRFPGSAR